MRAMGGRWTTYKIRLSFFLLLILVLVQGCSSLNPEGLALLDFRAHVCYDPYEAFANWNPDDHDPCTWSNVHCVDGNVQALDLNGLSLEGVVAPEIGKLAHLRRLVLSRNQFSGPIPKELGELRMLEVLDLRDNNLSGNIPPELGRMQSLKRLLLCNNKFEGTIPMELVSLNMLYELQFDENLTSAIADGIRCLNRKFGHCIWHSSLKLPRADSFIMPIKETFVNYLNPLQLFRFGKGSSDNCCLDEESASEEEIVQDVQYFGHVVRRKLAEQPVNLVAAPSSEVSGPDRIIALPSTRSSGSFPAVPKDRPITPAPSPAESPTDETPNTSFSHGQPWNSESISSDKWKIIVGVSCGAFLLITALALLFICRSRAVKTIGPWRTGLSGQLQKAFVTGVPKLNRTELETACEDFSNIIETKEGCTLYKGTLSSGVEICVAATTITSLKDWSRRAEIGFRKKIDTLSRINHKNFVNLIGYCEENEPFVRMMVFEYAPNGSLSEHLHVKELEHLDWRARIRIVMGTAYCLEYIHELKPTVVLTHLKSTMIYLTDDYAPKVAELSFWTEFLPKGNGSVSVSETESEQSVLPPLADMETNIYSFGVVLLEIISGKLPYSEEQGPLVTWASQYLNDKQNISCMIDPTLKSFNEKELEVLCEVIQECIQQDPRQRPTIKEVITKLREVIDISPEQATPRLSPLWWAELEILSQEAA